MTPRCPPVIGIETDEETRCAHYHTPLDIIAIKMKCCGTYYACKECHEALADHKIEVWPKSEWTEKVVLCGHCYTELAVQEYMASGNRCPVCSAEFNPGCVKHYSFYFQWPVTCSI